MFFADVSSSSAKKGVLRFGYFSIRLSSLFIPSLMGNVFGMKNLHLFLMAGIPPPVFTLIFLIQNVRMPLYQRVMQIPLILKDFTANIELAISYEQKVKDLGPDQELEATG